jgi:hypothetical protein
MRALVPNYKANLDVRQYPHGIARASMDERILKLNYAKYVGDPSRVMKHHGCVLCQNHSLFTVFANI